ncbi:hypothetical protein [Micromonospora aurantiaca (nom. illeg.)]|uniref:hypothetical protein n=1 Tax=Micromonospora aurantiaca (nom. illeg.) TaxID=47850 RepID=UPI003F4A79AD
MSSPHTYTVGDRVTIDPAVARASTRGVTYRVTRLLPVNVVVEPVDGGRPVKVNPTYLRPAPTADSTTTTDSSSIGGGTHSGEWAMLHEAPLHPGTLVTVAGPGWKQPPGELYVVLRDTGTGRSPSSRSAATTAATGAASPATCSPPSTPPAYASTPSRPPEQRPHAAVSGGQRPACPPDTT